LGNVGELDGLLHRQITPITHVELRVVEQSEVLDSFYLPCDV
jgi:hypothetical protein